MASESESDNEKEAMHHKTLAESSFTSGDFMSALNHARKALSLSPNTEGFSAMVTAFEIIISAADTAGGLPEWYKVLKVEPFSHINTIKQQYRKLALVLHPDKNPYAGCEEGFKLLNEAFRVFSDKVRRTEYDMKLRIRIQGEMGSGGCDDDDETSTFSTVCSGCSSVHKFGRKYLGQNLMCPACKNSFEAKEAEKEEEGGDRSETGTCASKIITYSRRKKRSGDDSESLRRGSETEKMREERAETMNVSDVLDVEDEGMMTLAEMQSVIRRKKSKEKPKITKNDSTGEENMGRETQERSSGDVPMTETLREMRTTKENEKREASKNRKNIKKKPTTNHKVLTEIVDLGYVPRVERKRNHGKLSQEMYREDEDFELYDFDKDRMPRSFKKGQIWAIYDGGDENMPRSYCLVNEVVSLNPFKVWISWLDFESEKLISWMKISSHMPCGRFRVSVKALVEQVKPFSHIVNCERAAREVYQIYPRKGSVWAVYSETNPALQRRKTRRYEIVVCLTMYTDAYGLSVAYLEKVNDCSNLFKRRDYGYNAVKWIEKDDVTALLSHQIPAKKLPEDESGADLKECWVLDLASVPPDLVSAT
ncbi:hypothetical protein CARUB_v10022867mg [Capsella rubella]|uniref:J domain-containing protein n=1 Tax=Capsella rubella TaxID=81985 RepID=R0HNF2_9BRAS|nr:uncharacterized protein LOC17887841 [Capsella rubella]EOA26780.1 hypothetical protein CARUB_v10022867mg [Capsella rubella]